MNIKLYLYFWAFVFEISVYSQMSFQNTDLKHTNNRPLKRNYRGHNLLFCLIRGSIF